MNRTEIAGAFAIVILAAAAWYVFANYPEAPGFESAFIAEGNLVKDNSGMVSGVWYLVYEEPGFAALSVPLTFNAESVCGVGSDLRRCDMSFLPGDRVLIEGVRTDDRVLVRKLVFTKAGERGMPIHLYYYNPEKDKDAGGNSMCSKQGLQQVERVLPHTETPLQEAIKLLLHGEISDEEDTAGMTREFPMIGVRLENATIQDGLATLTFSDPRNKTSGGSCRVSILWRKSKRRRNNFRQ